MESRIDHLETELSYLDHLLIRCGFPEGIATLKMTAQELLKELLDHNPIEQASE
jgi:hypothetical protein